MPIRMEKDPQQERRSNNPRHSNTGGGGLGKLIPFILMFLLKKPKLLIPVLVVGGIWYFFLGGQQQLAGGGEMQHFPEDNNFSFGASFDQQKYDETKVFEPLAAGSWNKTPSRFSLREFAPRRMQQGRQGSCVGWASAYAGQTIMQARATGKNPNQVAFSPSYLYNQIALENCQGAYMADAMKAMHQNGGLPFTDFRYDEGSCSAYPQQHEVNKGQQFRIKGYNRLTLDHDKYKPDILAIKQNIAQGAPVIIGMQVGGTFMSRMVGQKIWRPTQTDYGLRGFSGHAMCVIGYDDKYQGGAFEIMNSWSEDWGDNGIAWVTYEDFSYFVKEAYGYHPMGNATTVNENKLSVEFGLLDLKTQKTIPLTEKSELEFHSTSKLQKGDKFKVLVANSVDCYVYVFGQETDGSSYVLFPYTQKHSAYCGITGTRLFPSDYSMVADDIGNTDYMAVIVSKKELNFESFNQRINNSKQSTYIGKVKEVIASERITDVKFKTGNTVAFDANTNGKNIVGMVLALEKE